MKLSIYHLFTFLALMCISCNSRNTENDLKIEVTSSEIQSKVESDTLLYFCSLAQLNISDSLPVNRINFKITNSGKKAYILYVGKDFDFAETTSEKENIKAVVYKKDSVLQPNNVGGAVEWTMNAYNSRKFLNEYDADSLNKEFIKIYLKQKVNNDKIKFRKKYDFIVVHPRETKFFTFYRTFPYFSERNFLMIGGYDLKQTEKYYFQISLKNSAKNLLQNLDENQLKEIKENQYSVFNGTIKSNKIPIKFIH
jgi:hypothetical protein